MLIRLEELGLAIHRRNVIPEGIKPQPSALNHAQKEPLVAASDWLLVFDADEFLCINHPSGTLEGMLDDTVARGANGVVITWRIFGSGGVVDWSRAPVTEQYTRAAPPLWNKGWGVKTLFRFDPDYWKLGIHRPSIKNKWLETDFPDTVRWLNGSGLPMEDYFKFRGWRSIRRTRGLRLGADEPLRRQIRRQLRRAQVPRQREQQEADKYNADYWALQDRNEVEDRAILRHAERRAGSWRSCWPIRSSQSCTTPRSTGSRRGWPTSNKTDAYARLRDGLIEASKVPITQVEAKPPKARDPAKIAALMSRVEKQAAQARDERRTGTAQPAGPTPRTAIPTCRATIDLSATCPRLDRQPRHRPARRPARLRARSAECHPVGPVRAPPRAQYRGYLSGLRPGAR
jgi:hypothetical protein